MKCRIMRHFIWLFTVLQKYPFSGFKSKEVNFLMHRIQIDVLKDNNAKTPLYNFMVVFVCLCQCFTPHAIFFSNVAGGGGGGGFLSTWLASTKQRIKEGFNKEL